MNEKRLFSAEKKFLKKYPEGFQNPEIQEMAKKHKMSKLIDYAQENFAENKFKNTEHIITALIKMVTSSSMVSLFEKPKFRDTVKSMSFDEQKLLVKAYKELIYGSQEEGFHQILLLYKKYKLAKWTLMTVVLAYLRPKKDLFVKPNTTKGIINYFELDLKYHPTPSWEFYKKYRQYINKIKRHVDKSLYPSNAALTGFLMMSLPQKD